MWRRVALLVLVFAPVMVAAAVKLANAPPAPPPLAPAPCPVCDDGDPAPPREDTIFDPAKLADDVALGDFESL